MSDSHVDIIGGGPLGLYEHNFDWTGDNLYIAFYSLSGIFLVTDISVFKDDNLLQTTGALNDNRFYVFHIADDENGGEGNYKVRVETFGTAANPVFYRLFTN